MNKIATALLFVAMRSTRSFLIAAMLFTVSATSHAVLISVDLFSAGDGLLTRDTDSGLEWLDLTETFGRSYDDVSTDAALAALGFRYADADDVAALLAAAGILSATPSVAGVTAFIGLLSASDIGPAGEFPGTSLFASGIHTLVPFDPTMISFGGAQITDAGVPLVFVSSSLLPSSFQPNFSGSFLIRDVPEPSTLALLGAGLLGLGFRRRIRRG